MTQDDSRLKLYCCTELKYCRNLVLSRLVAVGNNIPALCICGTDGGNYGFAKILIYFTVGTVCSLYSKTVCTQQ